MVKITHTSQARQAITFSNAPGSATGASVAHERARSSSPAELGRKITNSAVRPSPARVAGRWEKLWVWGCGGMCVYGG